MKGTPLLKLSPDQRRKRLLADLFGSDFKPDERFEKAILQAKDDIQQRKVQQSQANAGGGTAAAAAAKTAKRNQKKAEPKDWVMEVLG